MDKYKFDVDDINYDVSHEELNPPSKKAVYRDSFFILLKEIFITLGKGLFALKYFLTPNIYSTLSPHKFLFVSFSNNNTRSLSPINEKLSDSVLITRNQKMFKKSWSYAILFIPSMLKKYIKSSGYLRMAYCYRFSNYCLSYGYYNEARNIIKKVNPEFITLANDHSSGPRCFLRISQKFDIKTIYVQHASVTENFPLLEFDYVFLDGKESLDIYQYKNEIKSTIFISGSTRFDASSNKISHQIDQSEKVKVGIGINPEDDTDSIISFIERLNRYNDRIQLRLRPHPSDSRFLFFKKEVDRIGIEFSNSRIESPFSFIAQNDIFISCESSFHLDVCITNKVCLYYNLMNTKHPLDRYWYLRKGLISNISDFNDAEILNVFSTHRTKKYNSDPEIIKYFVGNYNTNYWLKTAELISETLLLISTNKQNNKVWKKDINQNTDCYFIENDC